MQAVTRCVDLKSYIVRTHLFNGRREVAESCSNRWQGCRCREHKAVVDFIGSESRNTGHLTFSFWGSRRAILAMLGRLTGCARCEQMHVHCQQLSIACASLRRCVAKARRWSGDSIAAMQVANETIAATAFKARGLASMIEQAKALCRSANGRWRSVS
jgi:hypothetical protein